MKDVNALTSKKTPRPLRTGIKRDKINPSDFLKYNQPISCEDCTHFSHQQEICTIGYSTKWHRRDFQLKEYYLSGKVALCRFLEID